MDLPPPAGEWHHRPTPLDETASAYERRWGIDRLPRLVPPDLATRFQTACDLRDAEHEFANSARRTALADMMARAWAALEAAALAAGHQPLPPGLWEVPDPVLAGSVVVVCRDEQHAHVERLRAAKDGRRVVTYTLAEVAHVMHAHRMPLVHGIKEVWPEAVVRSVARTTMPRGGDAVPELVA